ncbi:hypothetical protein [uncultured Methanobrevibacter sp.]|uniref:hypothetical protein n=1 Tax=uncultured Methanobrevibacter sp. TaxID=253161 RepID=UPI0025F10C2D|nr:hypothetical protein [uncultured Methanobrevibacter sp.]
MWSREWVEIILVIPKNRRVLQNQLPKDNLFRGTKGKIVHPEVKKKQEVEHRKAIQYLAITHDKEIEHYQTRIKELEDKLDELKEDKNIDRIRFNNTLTKLNSLGIDVIRNKHKRIIDDSRLLVDSQAKDVEVIETKE